MIHAPSAPSWRGFALNRRHEGVLHLRSLAYPFVTNIDFQFSNNMGACDGFGEIGTCAPVGDANQIADSNTPTLVCIFAMSALTSMSYAYYFVTLQPPSCPPVECCW